MIRSLGTSNYCIIMEVIRQIFLKKCLEPKKVEKHCSRVSDISKAIVRISQIPFLILTSWTNEKTKRLPINTFAHVYLENKEYQIDDWERKSTYKERLKRKKVIVVGKENGKYRPQRFVINRASYTVSFKDLDLRYQDDYFWVNFDHFYVSFIFFEVAGAVSKISRA